MNPLDQETLLERARHTGAPDGTSDRLRARIFAAAASGVVASATLNATAAAVTAAASSAGGAAASHSLAGTILSCLCGGVLLGTVGSAALERFAAPAHSSRAASSVTLPKRPHSRSVMAPAVAPERVAEPIASARPAEAEPRIAPRPAAPLTAPLAPSIERETALLLEAQRALGHGNYAEALVRLNRYDRDFPNGSLAEEALCARAIAECSLGRNSERGAAVTFERRYPNSLLLSRVAGACRASAPR